MILIFKLILLTSIWVLGLTIITQPDMLLESIRRWAEKRQVNNRFAKFYEPLIICVWCMSSIHTLVGYSFGVALGIITGFSWKLVFMYPIVVMGTSLLSGLTWSVYQIISSATRYFNNAEKVKYFEIKDRKDKYRKQ